MGRADPDLENYSAGYAIVRDVRVYSWTGELAVMDEDLYHGLAHKVGEPVVGRVGGLTYEFVPGQGVPANSVNVPQEQHNGATPETLLVQTNL
jgi:hypothetical protein